MAMISFATRTIPGWTSGEHGTHSFATAERCNSRVFTSSSSTGSQAAEAAGRRCSMQDNLLAEQLMTQGMHADEVDGNHWRPARCGALGRHIGWK
jgi:hypothetical protein